MAQGKKRSETGRREKKGKEKGVTWNDGILCYPGEVLLTITPGNRGFSPGQQKRKGFSSQKEKEFDFAQDRTGDVLRVKQMP